MKHRLSLIVVVAAVAWFMLPAGARASEKEDAESLESLRADIEHRLPAGWTVTVDPAHRPSPHSDDESPALVIASNEKLAVETQLPNAAPGQAPFKELRQIEIVLAARPFIPPESYARLCLINDERIKSREAAERKLRDIPWASKDSSPIPPSAFRPRDEQERHLILEYAFLWSNRKLIPPPTHHFEQQLAFDLTLPLVYSTLTDKAKAKEYDAIVKSFDGLLKPYERPSQLPK